ncbi:MAG TPA: two-component regulator propeller domain-containing protein [Ohtaekwangia sp.]
MRQGFRYVFFAVSLLCHPAAGQPFNLGFDHYTTDNGLSQNEVFDIVQDHQGFIWFGTDEGLNRFDGHEFKVFKNEKNNIHSVIGNSIQALKVDQRGILWIGTTNGISRYYPDTELLEQLQADRKDPAKPNGTSVREMDIHPDGSIWISYLGDGLDIYDPDKNIFQHYSSNEANTFRIKNDYITPILFLSNGDKFLGSREGILVIGHDNIPLTDEESMKRYPWQTQIDNSIMCFQLAHDGKTLWIGTELNGLYEIDLPTKQVKNYTTENSALSFNNNVPTLYEDSKNNLWIGGEAIHLLDQKKNIIIPYDENGVQGEVIQKNPILAIYEDRSQNIWLGTYRLGALKHNPGSGQVLHFHKNQGEGSIRDDKVLSFNEDLQGNLWVGTDGGGLFKLKSDTKKFEQAPLSQLFSSQVIKCIYRDKAGYFWMGTWDGGMIRYHPERPSVEVFNSEKNNFKSRHVWDIKGDSMGNLWVGTLRDGLCYFNPLTKSYRYYKNDPNDPASLVNDDVMCLYTDSQNALWIGTSKGVSVLQSGAEKFDNLSSADFGFLNMNILCIYEDHLHRIWLGTNGGGIIVIDRNRNILKVITEKDGLSSSTICDLQPDDHRNVWVSTYNGLFRISVTDFAISEVPPFIGLQGKEFITHSGFRFKDGRLLFGGMHGFNIFHPDSLKFEHSNTNIVFTSLKILNDEIVPDSLYHGQTVLTKSITLADEINLSHEDYSFTLTYSPLVYTWQNDLHYAYMLEPLDEDWQYTTSQSRSVHYTNLAPGQYTLNVKASFDRHAWSSVKTITINMSPPWWASTGFRIAVLLFVSSVLIGIYRFRVGFLSKQKRKLEALVSIRTFELRQSNEEIQLLLAESAEQKKHIEFKNIELNEVNEKLQEQRNNLEQLVTRRTEKLNQTLHELETFIYRASHDLRGPISSMLGLVQIISLEKNHLPQDKHFEFLKKTIIKLERTLQKLIQKYSIQNSTLVHEQVTKKSLLALIHRLTKEIASFRAADFEINIQEDIAFETDITILSIILTNLLENAFFFSDRAVNTKVLFAITQREHRVTINIQDHGPGIKPEIRDKIFTMFFRGNEDSTGNGLGLYLVQSALNKINGSIEIDTEVGSYSRFTVVLD